MPSLVLKEFSRKFASDNNAGVHPEILEAISRSHVGPEIAVFFTFHGTGASATSIARPSLWLGGIT
jgi:hypothetical protein